MTRCKGIEKNGTQCTKNASFGNDIGKRIYCKRHKKDGMKNTSGYPCDTCGERAYYGYSKEDEEFYCLTHKEDDMENVFNKKCIKCMKK